jgi:hypothetical protein
LLAATLRNIMSGAASMDRCMDIESEFVWSGAS